jgi:hypothetical protein
MTRIYCSKCSKTGKIWCQDGSTIYASIACWDCGKRIYSDKEFSELLCKARKAVKDYERKD